MTAVDKNETAAAQAPKSRLAGRVIVLDPDDRVLLFCYEDPPPNGRHWSTPGGGLDEGEDFAAGALRELIEETGWTDVPIGAEVHRQSRTFESGGRIVLQHERFFPARVLVPRRELGAVAAMHDTDGIDGWHWWSLAELDASDETIVPTGLVDVVRKVIGGSVQPG